MRVLHIGIPVNGLSEAFHRKSTDYRFIEWGEYVNAGLTSRLCELLSAQEADISFFHLQQPIPTEIIEACPGFRINWTWDKRLSTPAWYLQYSNLFDKTIFPCRTDVTFFNSMTDSNKAVYIPPHVDINFYDRDIKTFAPDVVFIGNNFDDRFPNSQNRSDMVDFLRARLKTRFGVYGHGWGNIMGAGQRMEKQLYNGCKVAINHNHIDSLGYTSDRMMRAMSCGVATVSSSIMGGIPDIKENVDYLPWSNYDELINRIEELLEDDVKRNAIAACGYEAVRKNYSWDSFVEKLFFIRESERIL